MIGICGIKAERSLSQRLSPKGVPGGAILLELLDPSACRCLTRYLLTIQGSQPLSKTLEELVFFLKTDLKWFLI
jgi:hypothetical protein